MVRSGYAGVVHTLAFIPSPPLRVSLGRGLPSGQRNVVVNFARGATFLHVFGRNEKLSGQAFFVSDHPSAAEP